MQKDRLIVRTAFLALVAGLVLAPAAALADRPQGRPAPGGRGGGGHHVGTGPFAPHRGGPHRSGPHGFTPHRFDHRPFSPFAYGYAVSPFVAYAPPPFYYNPSALYDPAVVYDPPVVYSPPPVYSAPQVYAPATSRVVSVAPVSPPPPPAPTVIEYPTGRYELRGDGTTTAYTWVWIPNPPPPPPAGPPSQLVVPSGSPSGEQPAPRRSQLYRWTDDEGVTHFTDRGEIVPEKYRDQTKRFPSS